MDSSESLTRSKRQLDEISIESPSYKRFKPVDLLDLLEEESESATGEEKELESVIRSLEEEIAGDGELGFLLHASDDELGLPPPGESPEKVVEEVVLPDDDVVERVADVEVELESGWHGWCEEVLYGPSDLADLTWQPMPAT